MSAHQHLFSTRTHRDVLIIQLPAQEFHDGKLVEEVSQQLHQVADETETRDMLLNLSGVGTVSTYMLGKILALRKKVRDKGGAFRICEIEPAVREVLAVTKLHQVLDISDTEAQALNSL
jgi:anti-anti-sigma factor